jgi:hypothetical protein
MRFPSREGWPEGPGCVCLGSRMIFLRKVSLILARTIRGKETGEVNTPMIFQKKNHIYVDINKKNHYYYDTG